MTAHRGASPFQTSSNESATTEGAIVVEKVRESADAAYGLQCATDVYEDLTKAGAAEPRSLAG